MRRRQLSWLPALAHWFGVRPWEVELLTRREVDAMLEWIEAATDAS